MIKYYSKGYFKKIVLLAFLCCSVVNTFHVYSRLAIGLSWQNTKKNPAKKYTIILEHPIKI